MSLAALAIVFLAALAAGFLTYGRFLARRYGLDPSARTPAEEMRDGVDYEPTPPFYLLGQHFSAIAAAGPIVGPIVACQQFGWLPCLLWIGLGVVFIGAVHDFSALVASVRHRARSIAEIARQNLGPRAWLSLMAFIWLALVYVIVAFADVTASTFVGRIEELEGVKVNFERGGAVAFASAAYLSLAVVMGLVQRKWSPSLGLLTAIFVPATLAVVWLGTKASSLLLLPGANPQKAWGVIILAYCFVASLLPVWLLLQPRGYLGGFVLYIVLAVGVVGVFFGDYEIRQPAFTKLDVGGPTGALFPFLFVTIACGACSGFHGLVCSGTTSKQIARETHCRPVGYGGMLLEGFVALVALSTIMILAKPSGPPGAIYGQGIGNYLAVIIGKRHLLFAIIFGSMAFSTFVFDTLDVATRLGRYILQELFDWRSGAGAFLATGLTIGIPLFFILTAQVPKGRVERKDGSAVVGTKIVPVPEGIRVVTPEGPAVDVPKGEVAKVVQPQPAYMAFWTLFGTSNQLLAALTLLGITVWLRRSGKACWFTFLPMLFVMVITLWALVRQALGGFSQVRGGGLAGNATALVNALVAVALFVLAAMFVVEAVRAVRRESPGPVAPSPAPPA